MNGKLILPGEKKLITPDEQIEQNSQVATEMGRAVFRAIGTQFLVNLLSTGYRLTDSAGNDITDTILEEAEDDLEGNPLSE